MTDYKNLKLIATSSPHIREKTNTRTIMLDVCIALLPAMVIAVWNWGVRPLILTAVSVAACVGFEWLYRKWAKKPNTTGDMSAVVTGILLAYVCPVYLPYWMVVVGAFFAINLVSFSRADRGIGGVRPVAPPTWLVSNFLVRPASS